MKPVNAIPIITVVACACGDGRSVDTDGGAGTTNLDLVEEMRIDGIEADLVPIHTVAVAGDGSIAISQGQDHNVRFFSAAGEPLGSVGREGSGPGEFRRVGRMGWLADTLWVSEPMQSRVTLISPNRTLVRTINFAVRTRPGSPASSTTYGFLSPYALYSDESVLVSGQSEESFSFIHMTLDGDLLRVTTRIRLRADAHQVRGSDGSVASTNLFRVTPHSAVSPDGRLAAIARTNFAGSQDHTFSVAVMNRDADTVFARDYPFEGVPIPKSVVDSLVAIKFARLRSTTLANAFRREAYAPPVYPPLRNLLMADDGSVWVELRATEEGRPYLVLDHAGEVVDTVILPSNTTVAVVSGSSVYALELDEDDVQSVVRYRLQIK